MSLLKEHLDENNLQFIKRVRNPSFKVLTNLCHSKWINNVDVLWHLYLTYFGL